MKLITETIEDIEVLTEANTKGGKDYKIKGVFMQADIKNRNGRVYPVATLSKEELLEQLKQNRISCKDVSFRILGFSLAAINTIFSLVLSVIFIMLFLNYEKN